MKLRNTLTELKKLSHETNSRFTLFFAFSQFFHKRSNKNVTEFKAFHKEVGFEIGFHSINHDKFRDETILGTYDTDAFEEEFCRSKDFVNWTVNQNISVNRYPGLRRRKEYLKSIENLGITIDSSDHIYNIENCLPPLAYRLWSFNGFHLEQSNVLEVPCIWSDPWLNLTDEMLNKKIERLIKWGECAPSCISLMFHDKTLGYSTNNREKLFNTSCIQNNFEATKKGDPSRLLLKINSLFNTYSLNDITKQKNSNSY